MQGMSFFVIRRVDTGEYFRQAKGPTWAKQSQWVKEANKAKPYGNLEAARAALKMVNGRVRGPEGTLAVQRDMELVEYKVTEVGVVV